MLPDWPRAGGQPVVKACLRQANRDFQVEELLEIIPSDDGEFDWLWIEKDGDNTEFVARALARYAGVAAKAVTYSGLKDRHAVTRQWFCVHLPGKTRVDWSTLSAPSWRILRHCRHRQKLRRGSHRANRFALRLSQLAGDIDALADSLQRVSAGVPNYFGEQRFGRDGGNIALCRQWLAGEHQASRFEKGMLLSAGRAWLFNQVLAQRVQDKTWNGAVSGEIFALRDSGSIFQEPLNDMIQQRLGAADIHATGPLFGQPGRSGPGDQAAALEAAVFATEATLCAGLARHGLKMERRALRVLPQDFSWQFESDACLRLCFSLPRGCFATALVRELVNY